MRNEHHSDIDLILKSIAAQWPYKRWDQYNVLVAVSGGRDSVALLRALCAVKQFMENRGHQSSEVAVPGRLVVAHFNHRLRGDDSECDQHFVQQLAKEFRLECHVGSADSCETGSSSLSSENDLREQRYDFLIDIARKTHCRYIATAHHAGDQTETVLFRIFRGTGINGLAGIPAMRVVDDSLTIVRPLLSVNPGQIDAAMRQWNQPFRTDVSNSSSVYARNFLRNEVLPMLRERFGDQVERNLLRLGVQANELHRFVADSTQGLIQKAVSVDHGKVKIDCTAIKCADRVLIRELFASVFRDQGWAMAALGFRELDRLAKIANDGADVAKFQLPGAINCFLQSGFVYLERESSGS